MMVMHKHKKTVLTALVISESSHIFCCVLPTVFSVMSLLAGAGIMTMPAAWVHLHEEMHAWELPVIALSACVLAAGWGLHIYTQKHDCGHEGCGHPPCNTGKNKTHLLLMAATVLFAVNLFVYGVFHKGMGVFAPPAHEAPSLPAE